MARTPMTYAGTGVDYGAMDPFKVMAQRAAAQTDKNIERFGFKIVPWSRGESCILVDIPWGYLAFLVEGLGTKNLVADALYKLVLEITSLPRTTHYEKIAQCNLAMQLNDMITLGAIPFLTGQYLAVGDKDWFKNEKRSRDLVEGTRTACDIAGCAWGGGETPTLRDIIMPGTSDLAGAAVGWIADKEKVLGPHKIKHNDRIVLLTSNGIHANGLTLARDIAAKLPKGYLTEMPDGRTYGETLLDPTFIYVRFVEECLNAGIRISYGVNITGHGWRKLMRAEKPFLYWIKRLPPALPIFDTLCTYGDLSMHEAYGNLNMGAGFALYVRPQDVSKMREIHRAGNYPFGMIEAGYIANYSKKTLQIDPAGIWFEGDDLNIR